MHQTLHDTLQLGLPNIYRITNTARNDKLAMAQNMRSGECFWVNSECLGHKPRLQVV